MDASFYQTIYQRQQGIEQVPPNEQIAGWAHQLLQLLYPERSDYFPSSPAVVETDFQKLEDELVLLFEATRACGDCDHRKKAKSFFDSVPDLYRALNTDIESIVEGDPAANSAFEVIRAYPDFLAIAFYRIAHALHGLQIPLLPRILTEHAHGVTGIDIHPAAIIGLHFCIDHGTGIVIGETTEIGSHVKLYQGVTLGALSVDKSMANQKRHPSVEDHVVIYSGATILGGETVIGHHSVVGGNVWLTRSIAPYSKVYHKPETEVVDQQASI